MKAAFLTVLLVFALNSFGQSGAVGHGHSSPASSDQVVYQFAYTGQNYEYTNLSLNTTETIYEDKVVHTTCEKQVAYTEDECSYQTVYEDYCYTTKPTKECKVVNGKLECHVVPGKTICEKKPVSKWVCTPVTKYYTQTYPCTKVEKVAVGKVNKRYIARINYNFAKSDLYPDMLITTTLDNQGNLKTVAQNRVNGASVVLMGRENIQEVTNKYIVFKDVTYQLEAFGINRLLSPVRNGVKNLILNNNNLTFDIGRVYYADKLQLRLKVTPHNSGAAFIDRVLNQNEFRSYDFYGKTQISINLYDLYLYLSYGYYDLTIEVAVDQSEMKVLNENISQLSYVYMQTVYKRN